MKKYKLTTETKIEFGIKFYRIQAIKNFGIVREGEMGGWIENETNLSQIDEAWVSGEARVFGEAWVSDNAWVFGEARVFGEAWVSDNAWVSGEARVSGEAWVSDNAWVSGEARVFGKARVTKQVINLIGLKFNITICDNSVQVGCKFCLKSEINLIQHKDVADECTKEEFLYLKRIIKNIIT